jgi:hypothetical protein
MKTCSSCERNLPTPLDEYGPADAPLCLGCFFDGVDQGDPTRELQEAECYRDSILADLQDQHNLVSEMETQEQYKGSRDLYYERRELEELKARYDNACRHAQAIKDRPLRQLKAWGGKA